VSIFFYVVQGNDDNARLNFGNNIFEMIVTEIIRKAIIKV